jgi:hypothetical protein
MIKLTPDQTQLQINLSKIDAPIKRIEKRIAACINDLDESFRTFWSLPNDQINEILEYHGIAGTQMIFGAHNANGTHFNQLLESRGVSSPRAILTTPRELQVVDGNLRVVPLPDPVVEPVIVEEVTESLESRDSDFPN